ncbi:MAG: helix-turn-helix transcriptional regulator [Candidatus Kapabacteria bacterium]|nr:helix-turn-helix transcriptional regulator [Candidatus Kapabacteria bacterium]
MREESRVIGRNVRRHRQSMKWTQEMLAAEVKLSSDYISRLELGKENPTLDVLVRISIIFNRKVRDLLDDNAE